MAWLFRGEWPEIQLKVMRLDGGNPKAFFPGF